MVGTMRREPDSYEDAHGRIRFFWYGLNHEPLTIVEANALLRDPRRIIAKTDANGHTVSTAFLVLDHGHDDGPPVLYETMVFPECEYVVRTCSREEALIAHEEALAHVRECDRS